MPRKRQPLKPRKGHWTKGKPRSTVDPRLWGLLRQRLKMLLDEFRIPGSLSIRGLAARVGVTDRTMRRWLAGEDLPPAEAMATMRQWFHEMRKESAKLV